MSYLLRRRSKSILTIDRPPAFTHQRSIVRCSESRISISRVQFDAELDSAASFSSGIVAASVNSFSNSASLYRMIALNMNLLYRKSLSGSIELEYQNA